MWEFFSRKKEVTKTTPDPIVSVETKGDDFDSGFEGPVEQVVEKVNEKYAAILSASGSAAQGSSVVADDVAQDASNVNQAIDVETRVNQLVELAQVKGVAHAVEVARKMNNFYVLDAMHDELADKLYDALKSKGLILGE